MADDAPERPQKDERNDAQHTRTGKQPQSVPECENRIRKKTVYQQVGDKGGENRNTRVDNEDQPRRKVA